MGAILRIKIIVVLISVFSFINGYGQELEKHKWKNRILIVKAHHLESKKYKGQLNEFEKDIDQFVERKLILYKITKNDLTLTNYKNSALNHSGKISQRLADRILNAEENFEIILIGLDGQIKLRQTEILTKKDLFNIIDSMPMRRSEMRN